MMPLYDHPIKHRCYAIAALVVCMLLFTAVGSADGEEKAAEQPKPITVPDVVILVASDAQPAQNISIVYNGSVSEKTAEEDLKALSAALGREIVNAEIGNEEGDRTISLNTVGIVDWRAGTLQVEPFVLTFRRFKQIELVFFLYGTFPFQTLRNYSDKYVDIAWNSAAGQSTQVYKISIKNHDFDRLNLPLIDIPKGQEKASPQGDRTEGKGSSRLWITVLIAFLAGTIVFVVISRLTHARKE